jgi:hypothetical protein
MRPGEPGGDRQMVAGTFAALAAGVALAAAPIGEQAVRPLGEPVLEPPTLHCLGVYWIVGGERSGDARVELAYRREGRGTWRRGADLFRVEPGAHRAEGRSRISVPDGAQLFAGSILRLTPDTAYEIRLRLVGPDGGSSERRLRARTRKEPGLDRPARTLHVIPGDGGGAGTSADPFRGLEAAQAAARPGDLFLLSPGRYPGAFRVTRSGEPGRPIVWRGAGAGALLDGQGDAAARPGRTVDAVGAHDVWFERLTIRNADHGIVAHNAARLVVRGCWIENVEFGITATRNDGDATRDLFIADNEIEGPCTWPRARGIEDARGIQVTGAGHVIAYNRVRGFADGIDTFPSSRCAAIDIHNNDLHEMTDDGIEMDYSERNTRCFDNRLTNVFQGISAQPVHGGPVYIFRNVLYNVEVETFKLHNSPSGVLLFQNTSVKKGEPLVLWTTAEVRRTVSRNNLFVGTAAPYAYDCTAPMVDCDFDYDGFAGGPWGHFLRWNGARYPTLADVRARAPVYRHAVALPADTLFASGLRPPEDHRPIFDRTRVDLRLRDGSGAVDAGTPLPGLSDDYAGRAPDLGACELGAPLPHYGPRPEAAWARQRSRRDRVEDVSSMVAWRRAFLRPGMSDPETALAVWETVVRFQHQEPPPVEGLQSDGCVHDAIKTFNVYGYGMCCCAAANIAALGRAAGLAARGRILHGHSVPELFWDGSWRMLDASLINYFPKADGSLAGVDELIAGVSGWLEGRPDLKGNDPGLRAFMRGGGWRSGPEILRRSPFYDENGWLPAATHGWYSTMQEYDGSATGFYE